ncbi:toll/interleukin-1 receptor domain-containing protein [Geodermatophilus obscurus]|uniref:TIR protein n=1 Tax=Geodermatophilus obscurus (strain ATCC 25078 / DSM 43160 / JCM 3152 / CCUG 61914 / KCC A-0152 / KCTC 9177 / NBRC 13315 / NRRL B-3577 / G-20) TaxID=526225 RepID=D2S893_GEOOG|nr:toll/interleukin-1 receptor domain-containing protein [Geodermatophilus obscurus]ADB73515.1 TIR protein [Geodermatophilus obscurus DSM 43160]
MWLFVSYSRKDETAVQELVSDLERAHLSVWHDQELRGGDPWWQDILRRIRQCDVFLFLLSHRSLASKVCLAELSYARALGLPIVPVQVGPVGNLRVTPVADMKVVDYQERTLAHAVELLNAIQQAASERGRLPEPLPEPPSVPFEYLLRLGTAIRAEQLTPDQQGDFIRQLREVLETEDDEGVRDDARELLRALRRRQDITHRNAQAVDRLLADSTARETPVRLFVSYSRQDEVAVRDLVVYLDRASLSVWADRDLQGGDRWWQEVLQQIRECDVFLFVLSDHSLASKPCVAELSYARALGLPILPVLIGDIKDLHLTPVADVRIADYRHRTLAEGMALLDAIRDAAQDRRPLPDPLPKPPTVPFAYLLRLGSAIGAAHLTLDQQAEFIGQLREALETEDDENLRETAREFLLALRSKPYLARRNFDAVDRLLEELDASVSSPKYVGAPARDYGKAFLCHSSGDKERVRDLYLRLRGDGVPCWFDEEELLPGQDWESEIRKAIRTCQYVLACLSQASITKTGYVQKELKYALDVADEQPPNSIFLIPVRLEPCEVPDRLKKFHWADLYNPNGYQRLLKSLAFNQDTSVATPSGEWSVQ